VLSWAPIRYAHNGDVSIAWTAGGDGPVDLLFVGGFIGHLEIGVEHPIAQRFWERLGSFARVVAFDKRGMGLSDREAGGYTLENVVDDALAVLDAAGSQRAVVLGVSEGGSAATMLAAMHPDRVSALVEYGTYARLSEAPDYPEGIPLDRLRAAWKLLIDTWGDPGSLEVWAPSVARDPDVRDWWTRLLRSGASPGSARSLGEMYEELDVRPLLAGVRTPTLILYRDHDRVVPPALSRVLARGIPGAQAVELAGDDHLFYFGDQDAMIDAIEEFVTGRPAAAPSERILATVLFTDIVRSTERAGALGDRDWRELLDRHERLAAHELSRHRGRLIKSTGDGVLAIFDGPARAVRSAVAMREGARELGLELRAGVHTGECELTASDVSGVAVHLAARVEAAAQPGEVLASGTVKDLVVGSGLEFAARGVHSLRGIPGEWPLFAVSGDAEAARA